jgi:hypothetical protein
MCAKSTAVARPMPAEAPVIKTCLLVKEVVMPDDFEGDVDQMFNSEV